MNNVIEIKNLDFSYDKNKIYDSLSLCFVENEITYIMGNNGCGKTTLLKLITGFLIPQNGEILILGNKISNLSSRELAKRIAYVPQNIKQNVDFCVKDYLALGRTPYIRFGMNPSKDDYALVEAYAREMGILDFLSHNFNELSGGQKQLVSITRALIQETPIIILDEPMSALDIGKQADFLCTLKKLKQRGKTVILTSHNPNHALTINCNVCLINNNCILGYGNCKDVLSNANIEIVYGDKVILNNDISNVAFR